ncbi:MAG: TonB-dependent receptor [Hyphomicrobiaceae bacterium]|nr:TonB-dependent receptor [Hyphomicrobiaceae bacterium]
MLLAACGDAADARAQIALPEIAVTTSSPVSKPRAPRTPRPATPPAAEQPLQLPDGISLSMPTDPGFSSVTVMTPSESIAHGSPSLGDALSARPGIAATSFAPQASRPVIRGLGGFRVRTQENGIGSHDMANLGEDHAVTIDPLVAGQVEVIRGPATLLYGSQAIGGVLSAVNNRIPETVPEKGFRAETRAGYNSVSNGRDAAVMLEGGAGNFAVHVDTFRRDASDYKIPLPPGRQLNSSLMAEGYSVGGSYIFRDGFLGVAYSNFVSTYFIPGIASAAERNHIDLEQSKWSSRGEWRVRSHGIEAIKVWLGTSAYTHDEVDILGGQRVVGSVFKNDETEARLEIQHRPVETAWGELRGALGVQWGDRKLSVGGNSGELLAPAHAVSAAVFAFEELQLSRRLKLQAAARLDHVDVDGTGAQFPSNYLPPPSQPTEFAVARTFLPKSASLGLLYDLPYGITARLTAQHVERAPDAIEMFYKGPHDTPRTFEIGDPNMRIEKADTLEAGLKRGRGAFRFETSAYYTRFKDFIYKYYTGQTCDETFASCGTGTQFDQILYTQKDATFYGAEIQAEYDVGRLWKGVWGIEGQYDFVHATFADGGNVPKITPHRLGAGLYYRDADWTARVALLHAFDQRRVATFETPTAGYNLLSAELTRTFDLGSTPGFATKFTVGIKGENLLDDDVRNHVSYKKDEVLQPGRNIRIFGSVKLN